MNIYTNIHGQCFNLEKMSVMAYQLNNKAEAMLCADVQNIPDGTGAKIKIVEKDADGDDVATLTTSVSGGRIECAWKKYFGIISFYEKMLSVFMPCFYISHNAVIAASNVA